MKDLAIRAGLTLSRLYMRRTPLRLGKEALWRNVCLPYINWREIEMVSTTRSGFRLRCNTEDQIQAKIIYFGEWEPALTAFLRRRLVPGDGFIDVGANIGYFSLLAAGLVGPQGSVLAIEASPAIHRRLLGNLALNRAEGVRAVNLAVADRDGVVTIYAAGRDNIGATTTLAGRGFLPEGEVACAPLARIATPEELRRARVIKIDVEGAEAPILQDLARNVALLRPDVEIVSEISAEGCAAIGRSWQSLLAEFGALGFRAYELPNEYHVRAYISRAAPPPVRLDRLPARQFDMVMSRQGGDTL